MMNLWAEHSRSSTLGVTDGGMLEEGVGLFFCHKSRLYYVCVWGGGRRGRSYHTRSMRSFPLVSFRSSTFALAVSKAGVGVYVILRLFKKIVFPVRGWRFEI